MTPPREWEGPKRKGQGSASTAPPTRRAAAQAGAHQTHHRSPLCQHRPLPKKSPHVTAAVPPYCAGLPPPHTLGTTRLSLRVPHKRLRRDVAVEGVLLVQERLGRGSKTKENKKHPCGQAVAVHTPPHERVSGRTTGDRGTRFPPPVRGTHCPNTNRRSPPPPAARSLTVGATIAAACGMDSRAPPTATTGGWENAPHPPPGNAHQRQPPLPAGVHRPPAAPHKAPLPSAHPPSSSPPHLTPSGTYLQFADGHRRHIVKASGRRGNPPPPRGRPAAAAAATNTAAGGWRPPRLIPPPPVPAHPVRAVRVGRHRRRVHRAVHGCGGDPNTEVGGGGLGQRSRGGEGAGKGRSGGQSKECGGVGGRGRRVGEGYDQRGRPGVQTASDCSGTRNAVVANADATRGRWR